MIFFTCHSFNICLVNEAVVYQEANDTSNPILSFSSRVPAEKYLFYPFEEEMHIKGVSKLGGKLRKSNYMFSLT